MSYCTVEEINSLFGDISDEVSPELFETVIANSTAWIDSNLRRAYVPIPEINLDELTDTENDTVSVSEHHTTIQYNLINVPDGLRTAAIYYAASDIILSLYHGDELPVQYDVWFQKAQQLLDDYIESYLNNDAEETDLLAHQMVKHSHSRTYNQKRGRRNLWAR